MADDRAHQSVMAGHGFYSRHSAVQHAAAAPGYPMLARAADHVPLEHPPVVIADMGCAGGRNEIEPMRRAIAALRSRDAHAPIVVVHADLPGNDWGSLFATVETDGDSYLAGQHDVFAYGVGRSLYGPLLPHRSLHLGWTAITVHWLSAMPVVVPDTTYSNLASGETRDALREQSRRDWEGFLAARAREMHDGGQVVVVGGASKDDGASDAEGLFRMIDAQLRGQVDQGDLRRSEYEHIFYPTWNRTRDEFLAPITGSGAFADVFTVEEITFDQTSDSWAYPQYEHDHDADAFATAYVGFVRAITEPSFFRWLEDDRSDEQRSAVVERFYDGLRQRIAADPESATCHWCTVSLRFSRRAR